MQKLSYFHLQINCIDMSREGEKKQISLDFVTEKVSIIIFELTTSINTFQNIIFISEQSFF